MRKFLFAVGTIVVLASVVVWVSAMPSPLPAPPPLDAPLPPASPPPGMAIYRLPTGITHRSTGFAYRGGSLFEKRDFAMTAVLVKHPKGDVLIDTGFGRGIDTQIRALPLLFRMMTSYEHTASAADLLRDAGYDMQDLKGIILTHAHWDHVSGVADFPAGVPVLLPEAERSYVDEGGAVMALARTLHDVAWRPYKFAGGPYLGFPASSDLWGDGTIVMVPAPGHTPGSVIVFVTLPGDRRYAFIGDLVWQLEGIREREERPWLLGRVVDDDAAAVRANLLRVVALTEKYPQITIVPAHDLRGFESIPEISKAALAPGARP